MTVARTSACPSCGAVYAELPPTCLICGHPLAHSPSTGTTAVGATPPRPATAPSAAGSRRPRGRTVVRAVSLVSMVAGLGLTAVGAVRALSSGGRASGSSASASRPTPSPPSGPHTSAPQPPTRASQTPTTATTAGISQTGAGATTCTNAVYGYTFSYRAPWIASSATREQDCAIFDTSPISQADLLQASRTGQAPRAAITIGPYGHGSAYGQAVIAIHNQPGFDASDTIDLGVGNTLGERIMARELNGNGALTHTFLYLFDVRGKAFSAAAYEPYSTNFSQTVAALDSMMRTLRVSGCSGPPSCAR